MPRRVPAMSGALGLLVVIAFLALALASRPPRAVTGQPVPTESSRQPRVELVREPSLLPASSPTVGADEPEAPAASAPERTPELAVVDRLPQVLSQRSDGPHPNPLPEGEGTNLPLPGQEGTRLPLRVPGTHEVGGRGEGGGEGRPPSGQPVAAPASPGAAPATPRPAPPAAPPRASGGSAVVPIFMYHHVGPLPPNPDRIRVGLTVSASDFEAQLRFLAGRGYQAITFDQLLASLEGGAPLPTRSAILTFDDGYRDNVDIAFPLLQRYRFAATFFIVTDLVGRELGTNLYLTWDQLRALAEAGISIQAHSRTHADLTRVSRRSLLDEVRGSKQALEEQLGREVTYFCYPSGKYNADVIRAVQDGGYRAAVTVNYGLRHRPGTLLELPRVRVSGGATLGQFAAAIGERL